MKNKLIGLMAISFVFGAAILDSSSAFAGGGPVSMPKAKPAPVAKKAPVSNPTPTTPAAPTAPAATTPAAAPTATVPQVLPENYGFPGVGGYASPGIMPVYSNGCFSVDGCGYAGNICSSCGRSKTVLVKVIKDSCGRSVVKVKVLPRCGYYGGYADGYYGGW